MNMDSRYLQAIWDVTEMLQNESQMENSLSECLTVMTRTIEAEAGVAWLVNSENDTLNVVACDGTTDITGVSIKSNRGILGRVFETREPVTIDDARSDPRFSVNEDEEAGIKTRNTIIVPLATRTDAYGCIQLINKRESAYTEGEQLLMGNLAALIAIDIEDKGFKLKIKEHKEPVVRLINVIKDYPSGEGVLHVLKGINLEIYKKEFLVILGESGCGKSTMLNIIGGMDSLTDGTFMVEDKDYTHASEKELTRYRRDYIGFIFQSYYLMPNLNVLENIQFIAENSKDPISAEDTIRMVGLEKWKGHMPSQMSGGQQQRVSIARALVKNPKLILADEPTAALDYQTSIEVLQVVEDIVRNQHKTVVMITHNPEIAKMADRVVRIRNGLISSIRINSRPLKAVELVW